MIELTDEIILENFSQKTTNIFFLICICVVIPFIIVIIYTRVAKETELMVNRNKATKYVSMGLVFFLLICFGVMYIPRKYIIDNKNWVIDTDKIVNIVSHYDEKSEYSKFYLNLEKNGKVHVDASECMKFTENENVYVVIFKKKNGKKYDIQVYSMDKYYIK